MNQFNIFSKKNEGFQDKPQSSPLAPRIKAVLDPMVESPQVASDLCSVFETVKKNMMKNEKTDKSLSDQEVERRVIKALSLKIPGGPLPCPLLQYPKDSATDIEWLTWLQSIPSDFGARIVLMANYANTTLASTATGLRDALSGKGDASTEPFTVCPPDVAATRRAEKASQLQSQSQSQCILPENAKPEDIQEQVTLLLKTLVAKKNQILKENNIDTNTKISTLLQSAKTNQAYLEKQGKAAEEGSLEVKLPPQP